MSSVLIIEDDPEILENVEEILELQNFQAWSTNDSRKGLEIAKEVAPDLVICDVVMPNIDGYHVLNELRQHEATATIPFIFLSGRADRAEVRQGMELGADDYLTKPFTNEELIRAVQTCLKKQARLSQQFQQQLQQVQALERRLQTVQELADLNNALLHRLSQGLRHPISNITIATHMLRQNLTESDLELYVSILEEECARGTSLLNEISNLQEYLNPSKLNLLRTKLKMLPPLS